MSEPDKPTYQELIASLSKKWADGQTFFQRPRLVETEATLSLQQDDKVHTRVANVTFLLFERLDIQAMDEAAGFWERALVAWEVLLGVDYEPVAYAPERVREMAEQHHFRQNLLPLYLQLWMAAMQEERTGGAPA
jgi:hypothetical protein